MRWQGTTQFLRRAAIVAVALDSVSAALERAARLGCRSAVVVSDDVGVEQARGWRQLARQAGMRLLGPGSMGFMRPWIGLDASRMGPMPVTGNVALIDVGGGKRLDTTSLQDAVVAFVFDPKGLMFDVSLKGAKFTRIKEESK